MDDTTLILLLIPIAVIELGFKVFALRDLWRRDDIEPGERWGWTAAILLVSTIGWLAYLLAGRQRRP